MVRRLTAQRAPRDLRHSLRRRRWPYVVAAVVCLVALALALAEDQEVLRVRSPVDARDPRFVDYVGALVGAPVSSGDAYDVLRNGDEIFPAMLDAVDGASHRISFESFIYSTGEVARTFTDAFARAARRGVSVRIVLDAFGSLDMPRELVEHLEAAGVKLVWFNVLRPWTVEETNYRTHRKVLVVDGGLAFVGGVGLADHWLGDAGAPEHWRDTQFAVRGPAVRALEAAFYENWLESGGEEAPALDRRPPPRDTGARSLVVWSNPTGGASNVKLLYLLSIAGARHTIDIQSPYFVLDESSRWALLEARARGVRVRVLTDGEENDATSVKAASRHGYQALLDAGCEIHEFDPTMMHVKAMVVDGVWSIVGSANFDNRSFELNDELSVAVADAELARQLVSHFGEDLARARRIDPEAWRARPIAQKLHEGFWSLFSEFF